MSKPQGNTEAVKVMVRVRPMNKSENAKGCKSVMKIDIANNQIEVRKPEDEQG